MYVGAFDFDRAFTPALFLAPGTPIWME